MNTTSSGSEHEFILAGAVLKAQASGALWWPERRVLAISDLHLGKSERIARQGGSLLPPYEIQDTLIRLEAEISAKQPETVVCLGDSFDDPAAIEGLDRSATDWLGRMMADREWIWIEGNHDPGPAFPCRSHLAELSIAPLTFRHVAMAGSKGEVSGHFHPKATIHARGQTFTRACFLYDNDRLILPAFGTYTGGLRSTAPELCELMRPEAIAVLTGSRVRAVPFR